MQFEVRYWTKVATFALEQIMLTSSSSAIVITLLPLANHLASLWT